MKDAVPHGPRFGHYGVWTAGPVKPDQAVEIERLGYGAVWVGGSPSPDLSFVEPILEQTEMLCVATGIVNIWSANAVEVAESYHRVEKAFPGRFLLGLGAGHREHTDEYQKPFEALVSYLDVLDDESVPASGRVLAALGPKVLDLAARRSAGAHPFLTTAAHTRVARESLDATVFLAPQQAVVLDTDAEKAREIGRPIIDFYLSLSNYRNNWKRLGFTDADLASPGSDRLIDALIAHGTAADIADRLSAHLVAGADHVAIQVLNPDQLLATLAALAEPLGIPEHA